MSDPRDEEDETLIADLKAKARGLLNEADEIRAEIVRRQFARARASLGSPSPPSFNDRDKAAS